MATTTAPIPAIDADGHIYEAPDDVRRYLEAPWNRRNTPLWPGDQPWDNLLFDTLKLSFGYKQGMRPEQQIEIWHNAVESHNIETAVLFPTGTHSSAKLQEPDFAQAVCRAANTLFAKEFTTKRLRPVGILPMRDPKAAVRELHRGVEDLGLAGFEVATTGLPFALGDPFYDPVYEAAEKLGTTICIHGTRHWSHELGGDRLRTFAEVHAYAFSAGIILQFTSVMCQGLPERFPNLKMAFLEVGATWLPYYLDRLDEHWFKRGKLEMPHVTQKPSDVFRSSQIKVSIEADETLLPQTVDYVGAEHLIYASDIPHWDNEFPHSLEHIRTTNTLTDEVKRKILYSNAKEFFRL